MTLDQLARDAGADVRDQVATIEPPTPGAIARRSRRGRMGTGLAVLAVARGESFRAAFGLRPRRLRDPLA